MSEQQKEQQLLETVDRIIAEGPYQPAWSSLMQTKTPDWFKQKRFGIFIHWGVYSVPANSNEWYPRNMYIEGMPAYEHYIKTYGSQKDFGYKDFIPMFHAEKFDPAEWVRYSKKPVPVMCFRLQNTMMDFKCTKVNCPTGIRQRWGRNGTYLVN